MIDAASSSNDNHGTNEVVGKDEDPRCRETIHCTPLKIYPLADEKSEQLAYPTITYHYSVSSDARYVYVIGEDPAEPRSHLFVWDLHRGTARRYAVINLPPNSQMKHLYEIDAMDGLLVCRSVGCFHIYAVQFDHCHEQIRIQRTLFCQLTNNGHFWSSARASPGPGIIFMSQHDQTRNFYVAQISLDAPVHSVFLTARMSGLRFCGQPWVHGQYMYLFESASATTYSETKYLTGRLVRADLQSGELDIVHTKALGTIRNSLPSIQQQQQPQQQHQHQSSNIAQQQARTTNNMLIRRVKHVERDGWLWIIAEFVNPHSNYNHHEKPLCEVCVLEMQTLTWYRLDWLPGCAFDELTLDVTGSGTVVMLRKKILQMSSHAQIDSFLLVSRNPDTLLKQSFRALIRHFPAWRNLSSEQMHVLGIPVYLLVPQ